MMTDGLSAIDDIIAEMAAGRLCVLVDGKDREDEGDLVACASCITPAQINFMATHGRGLICLAMAQSEADRLALAPVTANNQCPHGTAFMVPIDAREGIATGISAYDRARTIRLAADPSSRTGDFVSPGHVFPLKARQGGLFEREGHTEGAVALACLSGQGGCAVICEIMDEDGRMMRLPALREFARAHALAIGSIEDLKAYMTARKGKAA